MSDLKSLTLSILEEKFPIHRLPADATIPGAVFDCEFYSISRTADEVSIVVPDAVSLKSTKQENDWICMQVLGPLDFGLTGILAGIARVLAQADISIFSISTYDTDYILVKAHLVDQAKKALSAAGYHFLSADA